MSSVHTATTRSPYSLPSFASTFSKSPNMSSTSHALPPIQTLPPSEDHTTLPSVAAATASKKRPRPTRDGDESPSGSDHGLPPPPQAVRVKEEQDELADSPRPMHANVSPPRDGGGNGNGNSGAGGGHQQLSPSINEPPHPKKRRTTTSNVRQSSNFNVESADSGHSTPISPSVPAGHLTHRADRELLEQRRGSIHDHLSPYTGGPSANTQAPKTSFPETAQSGQPPSIRESPNLTARRPTVSGPPGITSPPPPTAGGSPLHNPPPSILPAPPNSFSGRRAGPQGGIRRKPADLHIQPRDARTVRELRPTIQSAPAFPRAGQEPGTFPVNVTLPTIPSTLGVPPTIRRTAAAVPPTPTRLTLRPTGPSAGGSGHTVTGPMPSISGRSPPVPIAASLVPPTPTTLRQPGYSTEKGAFLAPFESFYDSLADARELKQWLHEQVQRAQQLGSALQTQQDRLEDAVGAAVERAMAGQREEVHRLQARVAELENTLRMRDYPAPSSSLRGPANGASPTSGKTHESYTYPPVERHQGLPPPPPSTGTRPVLNRRISSSPHQGYDSRTASPPYDPRRLSAVSATRFEPPPPPQQQQQGGVRGGPPESPVGSGRQLAPLPHLSSSSRGSGGARNFYPGEQPSLSRHHSSTIPEHGPLPESSSSSRLNHPRVLSDDQPVRGRPRSHSTAG